MLPEELTGPGLSIQFTDATEFLENARSKYPTLTEDFVLQICFEHADRFNQYFPKFSFDEHSVINRKVNAEWIRGNVRYDDNKDLTEFWRDQFNQFYKTKEACHYPIFRHMVKELTWPFPPVIVENRFGIEVLGSPMNLGSPYHLIEGTHRTSYLLTMLENRIINGGSMHDVLEIVRA
jgi:hypothetical protein